MASYRKKRFTNKYKKIKRKIGTKKLHIILAVILFTCMLCATLFCIIYFLKNNMSKPPFIQTNNTTVNITTTNIIESNISNQTIQENQTVISSKPKLAIIIDDVSFANQLNNILSIPLKLTPSFLPPVEKTNFSPKLANNVEFYMVHLPLEAMNFKKPEKGTLLVSDSYETILQKLKNLKAQFPHAIYYNNHTGSKFTADIEAMKRLFKAMDEVGLIFVDSRTTADTKAPQIAKKEGKRLLQRDVFLDNTIEKDMIKEQISLAIFKAKEKGYAIAIGHPHKETMEALRECIREFDEVEVVYLRDL